MISETNLECRTPEDPRATCSIRYTNLKAEFPFQVTKLHMKPLVGKAKGAPGSGHRRRATYKRGFYRWGLDMQDRASKAARKRLLVGGSIP
jgi:hypothetical protein